MKPAPFDYIRAETEDEVLAALHAHGADARIIAGGQTLVAMLSMRLARPAVLIDIMRIPTLARIADERDALVFQAAVRQQAALDRPTLAGEVPLLAAALPWVGHYQTRARGTICGSVAHADPSAEIPLCLVALRGEVHLRARRRHRRVPAETFFTGMMVTDRRDDEFISSVSLPKRRAGTGHAFAEFGRRHGDFAIVACAAVVDAGSMRLAVAGVADRPAARDLPILDGAALAGALNQFAWDLE
ncbi:MAG: FAD binding domain-containing protein, partial [Acetobacteraceae bacterium]|nr:FAD binding domain-containing protein [Acetobacteraceae bacterium]